MVKSFGVGYVIKHAHPNEAPLGDIGNSIQTATLMTGHITSLDSRRVNGSWVYCVNMDSGIWYEVSERDFGNLLEIL